MLYEEAEKLLKNNQRLFSLMLKFKAAPEHRLIVRYIKGDEVRRFVFEEYENDMLAYDYNDLSIFKGYLSLAYPEYTYSDQKIVKNDVYNLEYNGEYYTNYVRLTELGQELFAHFIHFMKLYDEGDDMKNDVFFQYGEMTIYYTFVDGKPRYGHYTYHYSLDEDANNYFSNFDIRELCSWSQEYNNHYLSESVIKSIIIEAIEANQFAKKTIFYMKR